MTLRKLISRLREALFDFAIVPYFSATSLFSEKMLETIGGKVGEKELDSIKRQMRYDNINQNEEQDDGKKYGNLVNMLI